MAAAPVHNEMVEAPKLELYCLKGSPYSLRVKWALSLLQVRYAEKEHAPLVGEFPLRWRLGRWKPWQNVTVPIGFVKQEGGGELQLENGIEIVEWADTKVKADGTTSLVPSSLREEIAYFCAVGDDLQDFGRKIFLEASWKDPSLMRAFVGEGPPDLALHVASTISGTIMSFKYKSTMQGTVPQIREKMAELQRLVVEKQEKVSSEKSRLVYLVGVSLTAADIFVSTSLCGGPATKNKFTDRVDKATTSLSFDKAKEFPILMQWAKDIVRHHGVDVDLLE